MAKQEKLIQDIKAIAAEHGVPIIGFGKASDIADVKRYGPDSFDFPTLISMSDQLPLDAIKEARTKPSIDLRESYKVVNRKLMGTCNAILERLAEDGYKGYVIHPANRPDAENLRGFVSLKAAARVCGLGWIGKNGLLVTKEFGPRQRSITIFTDMPWDGEVEMQECQCGDCRACIENCALKVLKDQPPFKYHPPSRDVTFDWEKCGKYEARLVGDGSKPEKACGRCIAHCPLSYPE